MRPTCGGVWACRGIVPVSPEVSKSGQLAHSHADAWGVGSPKKRGPKAHSAFGPQTPWISAGTVPILPVRWCTARPHGRSLAEALRRDVGSRFFCVTELASYGRQVLPFRAGLRHRPASCFGALYPSPVLYQPGARASAQNKISSREGDRAALILSGLMRNITRAACVSGADDFAAVILNSIA